MRTNAWLFSIVAGFFFVVTIVYWYTSYDPMGTTALAFSFGLNFLIAFYLGYSGRRLPLQLEDTEDAEIEQGAGEVGFFSPHSIWPFWMGLGAAVTVLGIVFGWWLFLIGVGVLGGATLGLLFQYQVGQPTEGNAPEHVH